MTVYTIPDEYVHLSEAYMRLLRTPLASGARMHADSIMASMRDVLADAIGAPAEYVQNYCEEAARRNDYILTTRQVMNGYMQMHSMWLPDEEPTPTPKGERE